MGHPDEKGRIRPLFRFTDHLNRVPGIMPDGSIVSVKTDRMAFSVQDNGQIWLGEIPHIVGEFVGGPLDGARFGIPAYYGNSLEAWSVIAAPAD